MPIAAGQTYALTVHDVPSGAASGTPYNLQFSGCAFVSTGSNHPPVALARDVNVVADANHSANASVDNGSYDPRLGRYHHSHCNRPLSPYRAGATPVVLTVVDSQGARRASERDGYGSRARLRFWRVSITGKNGECWGLRHANHNNPAEPCTLELGRGFTCSGLPPLDYIHI